MGKIYNEIKDIDCPRCQKSMHHQKDVHQNHIEYEVCLEHGVFMDAGEFSDYKVVSILESVQNLLNNIKNKTTND
ncbi:MAG: zf-TFIIB domain-containing protein [Gammaproteobacteria bacterium]|nr:zf-TFIIB domain-containing protein [Gammaproteobacteria bacterium]